LISFSVIAANAYINYTYSPKLAIGVRLAGGYNLVGSPSQSQTFEQVNALANSSRRNPRRRNYKRLSLLSTDLIGAVASLGRYDRW
jgi:hypothetical protein